MPATPLESPLPFEVLYGAYRDSWRVTEATSLFIYPPGQGPDDLFDPTIPGGTARLDLVDPDTLAPARAACEAEGLTADDTLFDCVLDALCQADDGPSPPTGVVPTVREGEGVALRGAVVRAPRPTVLNTGLSDEVPPTACAFASAPTLQLYDEGERTLSEPLTLDVAGPGRITGDDTSEVSEGEIAAGTAVRSWLLHLPPRSEVAAVAAELKFGGRVLGLMISDEGVADTRFVPDGQEVINVPARGLRLSDDPDTFVSLDEGERTVRLTLKTGDDPEQVRVLVEAPEEVAP